MVLCAQATRLGTFRSILFERNLTGNSLLGTYSFRVRVINDDKWRARWPQNYWRLASAFFSYRRIEEGHNKTNQFVLSHFNNQHQRFHEIHFYLEFSNLSRYFRITCEAIENSNATQLRFWNHCEKVVGLKFLMLQWLHSGLTFFCPSVSEHHVRWGFRHRKLFLKCFRKKLNGHP